MTPRTLAIAALAATIPVAAVGVASATPGSDVSPVPHVIGAQLPGGVKVNADGVKFQTKAPTDVSVLTLTLEPGETTGWHSHPGLAIISVAEGTGRLYAADCSSKAYGAGDAFVEDGDDAPTVFRNESDEPVVLTVTFVAPRREAILRDEADPGCGLR